VETTGGIERRPTDEDAARPDELDAVSVDPTAEPASADGVEVIVAAASDVGVGGAEDAGDKKSDAPVAVGTLAKVRGPARLKIDAAWLTTAWRAHSVGRVALLAVCGYALCVGAAYFFLMQPLGAGLHEVKEQKSILLDYMVIQQAGAAIGSFKDGLMTGDQRLTVLSEVNQMAEKSHVKIVGDPDLLLRRDVSTDFVEYPVRLRVRGTYHEMGVFLSLLESSSRFVIVEEIEIRSDVDSRNRDSEATVLLTLAAWEG
jgi:hypothetical protein